MKKTLLAIGMAMAIAASVTGCSTADVLNTNLSKGKIEKWNGMKYGPAEAKTH